METRAYPLDDGPIPFRRWLASLPQDKPIPCLSACWEPFIYWLRKTVDPKATLVRDERGEWQNYRCGGVVAEVPGTFFYAYDLYERGMTAAEYIAAWDASLAEDGYDHRPDYWQAFGIDREAVERMARR